jgi:hypothetical protein
MSHITAKHVENGRAMLAIIQHDVVTKGISFNAALTDLATFLEIDEESVKLGIAIANDANSGSRIIGNV